MAASFEVLDSAVVPVLYQSSLRPSHNVSTRRTVLVLKMAHRIWKETKQHPDTAGPDNRLGCCLVSFHFLWAILSTSTVVIFLL